MLAKTLWMVYYISGSAIGLKLPLMPLGVDHSENTTAFASTLKMTEITFDAVRR